MDVAESRTEEPREKKEARSVGDGGSSFADLSSPNEQLLDPVTKELKSQLPLFPALFPEKSGGGGDSEKKAASGSSYLDLLSNRQKPLPRRVREKLKSRRVKPTADPAK